MRLLLAGMLALLPGAAFACLPGFEQAMSTRAGGYTLAFKSQPAPIPVGTPFVLDLAVCPTPQGLSVDAHMPAHRHGMNYKPSLTVVAPGRYRAEGLVLHMPGDWEFVFEVSTADGRRERLTAAYQAQ